MEQKNIEKIMATQKEMLTDLEETNLTLDKIHAKIDKILGNGE